MPLQLTRLPGEYGPILRCSGDLTAESVGVLQQEIDRLAPMGHNALVLDLSGCGVLDVDGILSLLQTFKRLQEGGHRMALVVGHGKVARLLSATGIDWVMPSFPSEEAAVRALRGGGPAAPGPASWAQARKKTLARWRGIQETLDQMPPEESLRHVTSMTALCDRAEEVFHETPTPTLARCHFCPLFYALGGRPEDIGCQSVIDPIMEAVRAGDLDTARGLVAEVIRTIRTMPLPDEGKERGLAPFPPEKREERSQGRGDHDAGRGPAQPPK